MIRIGDRGTIVFGEALERLTVAVAVSLGRRGYGIELCEATRSEIERRIDGLQLQIPETA